MITTKKPPARLPALTDATLLDKAIAKFAPGWAAERQASRNQLALTGGYTGARIDRAQLSRWMPMNGSPTADVSRDLPMLRARSRDQLRNAPVALGAVKTKVSHTIGTGLTYTPALDAEFLGLDDEQAEEWGDDVKRRFGVWAGSTDCDLARQLDFYGLQSLAYLTMLESGDAPVITPRVSRNGVTRLALQLLEADRVCNVNRTANTATQVDGVEINDATGEAVALWIAKFHPGDNLHFNSAAQDWTRVALRGAQTGRRNALLIFKPLRPGQVRGIPLIAPILEPLKQLGRWSEAELNAAVISGINATFIKMDPDAFDSLYDEDAKGAIVDKASNWSGEVESGKVINLLPGEDISSPAPGRPNPAFDPFWTAMVRQIGMALELPYEVLVMHFQSSYSAARAALLMAYKSFKSDRDLIAKMLCQPVFELWLADEVAEGRIRCPGFFQSEVVKAAWCAAIWTGDGPGSIDPAKEVDAAQKRVDLGISTKQAESIAYDGVDWEQKHEQRVKEINAEKRDGIYFPPAGTPAVQTSALAAEDAVPPADDGNAAAFAAIGQRLDALAAQPHSITIHTPPVTVHAGDTHVAPAAVTVEGHEISVNLPEGCIQLEAVVQAAQVHVDVPPAQIVMPPRQATRQVHQRDADGNLIASITTFEDTIS
jgi:lambda family phage portal protein